MCCVLGAITCLPGAFLLLGMGFFLLVPMTLFGIFFPLQYYGQLSCLETMWFSITIDLMLCNYFSWLKLVLPVGSRLVLLSLPALWMI
ncbi:hypothetical protein GQ457_09G000970 [Hibiscus cannabinus]